MVSFRQGLLSLAALAALLLSGCASGFHDAGVPQASVYETQPGYPPVEKYPVTQARNMPAPGAVDEIAVTDLQPSPQAINGPSQSVVFKQNPPPNFRLPLTPSYQTPQSPRYDAATAEDFLANDPLATQKPAGQMDVAALIQQSRANYAGNCGCPYDHDSAGRRCGGRSAYSRAGGASVLCYPSDVTPAKQAQQYTYMAPAPSYGATGYGAISTVTGLPRTTYVSGYYRKNGTYVKPYYRSKR